MKVGDLVMVRESPAHGASAWKGVGIYLGLGQRGCDSAVKYLAFLWKGRVATFDEIYWNFEVINQTEDKK